MTASGSSFLELWRRLSPLPGGAWLFSRGFGFMVPYSGSVAPRIRVLEPGRAEVEIPDRRANRQHLGSVHAIALMNLAEMTGGLAMMAGLPPNVRGIVTTLSMTYHKKARGTIRAIACVTVPTVRKDCDFDVTAECFDREGTLVATGHARWRLGVVRPKV
jgi:acyl-coenzyme A thioesterase PaaI-like protein